ncbi:MAG: hypothetical protein QXZ70_04790 [Candidatus Bathyarchaeia archaeon]
MNRKEALILLLVVALVAVASSAVLTTYASENEGGGFNVLARWFNGRIMPGAFGRPGGYRCRAGPYGFIEVSAEFNQTVISIVEGDSDVQKLLAEGYTISSIRPIIKSVVAADGTVVTKASSAVVMLQKNSTGRAEVYVDVTNGKVTRIVIFTITVIEKS